MEQYLMRECRRGAHRLCGGMQRDRGDGTEWRCECSCHTDDLSEMAQFYAESGA